MRHPPGLRRHGLPDPGGPPDAGRGRVDRVQDHRVQLPGRDHHPGPAAPGGPDRRLRGGRAADHRPQRACLRGRVQAGGLRGRRRQRDPQDQAQRKRGQDHHSPVQEGLPPLRQRRRHGHRRLDVHLRRDRGGQLKPRRQPDHLRPRRDLEDQDHLQLHRQADPGAHLPGRQAGV